MIIVKLHGGMGNQMFQYAFGKYLAAKHQTELKLDLTFFNTEPPKFTTKRSYDLDIFNITDPVASAEEIKRFRNRINFRILNVLINKLIGFKSSYILEPHFHFSERAFNAGDNVFIEGYWQSEKYFKPIENQIRELFTLRYPLPETSVQLAAEISSTNSVCVNVRRGDFVNNPFHPTMPPNYYSRAENIILQKLPDAKFYVFSDDTPWCHENLKFQSPVQFVTEEHNGFKYQNKFRLMTLCRNFIVPNSSYAWWAAYLCNNSDKMVIAPDRWVADDTWNPKDLLPQDWIKISAGE